ncbi:MAG: hypothetical protein IBX39_08860 [Candidatus Methanoperedenaceae archaeon]|nr:hypothetical protein [Candidatus Methanoperedenaceae archaeon]
MPLNFFFSAWDDYLADQAQGININIPVEHYFKCLPLPRFQGAEKTTAGNSSSIPGTCRGCGTVQSCNLRIEGMTDLCTGQQPAPEGSIRIGDTFVQISKDLKKHYPAPNSFRWIDDPDSNRYEKRIQNYLTHQLGFAWIKNAAITITDYEITITGAGQITIEREDDELAVLSMKGISDLILNAKTTPNGEYWYINRNLIKRKVLRRLSDSKYIPEIALSNDREEEDKTSLEDYSATPYLSYESDIPYWKEPEPENKLRATPEGFEVVTRKQKKDMRSKAEEKRQNRFLINHGFRLKDKLESLLKHNPDHARIMASKLSFKDWKALNDVGGLSPNTDTGKNEFK